MGDHLTMDPKFMKNVDFEGVYILGNATQDKCFVGKRLKFLKNIPISIIVRAICPIKPPSPKV